MGREDPKKAAARAARWRAANPGRTKAAKKKCYEDKKEQYAENHAAYYKRRAGELIAAAKQWRDNNRARFRAIQAKRRARKKNASVPLTVEEQARILGVYAEARAMTELSNEPYHVDHIIPLAKGGLHHPDNLQVLRGITNLRKGTKIL
jgi:hypothetical protein